MPAPSRLSLTACLNGARAAAAGLPVTAHELAAAARAATAAGATALHVHPRDERARETLEARFVAAALDTIRAAAPGVPVGVTTAASAGGEGRERERLVRQWRVLPDAASVNFHEDGAERLAVLLADRGVEVEAGLWHVDAARAFAGSSTAASCTRVLLEPMEQQLAVARENAARMADVVAPLALPTMLHGVDGTAWALLEDAARLGLDLRMGLEDVLTCPDGRPAADNAELVREAVRLCGAGHPAGQEAATRSP